MGQVKFRLGPIVLDLNEIEPGFMILLEPNLIAYQVSVWLGLARVKLEIYGFTRYFQAIPVGVVDVGETVRLGLFLQDLNVNSVKVLGLGLEIMHPQAYVSGLVVKS